MLWRTLVGVTLHRVRRAVGRPYIVRISRVLSSAERTRQIPRGDLSGRHDVLAGPRRQFAAGRSSRTIAREVACSHAERVVLATIECPNDPGVALPVTTAECPYRRTEL